MKRVGWHVLGVCAALPWCAALRRVPLSDGSAVRGCATRAQHTSGFATNKQTPRPRYASQRARPHEATTSTIAAAAAAANVVRYRSQHAQASPAGKASNPQSAHIPSFSSSSSSSSSSVTERARVMQQQRMTPEEQRHALHRLNINMRDGAKSIVVRMLRSKMYEATLNLDAAKRLIARGVGQSAKVARRQCAGHALCILEVLRQDKLARSQTVIEAHGMNTKSHTGAQIQPSERGVQQTEEKDNARSMASEAARSAPVDAMLNSLNPRLAMVYRLYCYLLKTDKESNTSDTSATPKVHFRKDTTTTTTNNNTMKGGGSSSDYICRLSVHGMTCEGRGVNRFEAERTALESVITELSLHDERMQTLFRLVTRCPHMVPECIPTAILPRELGERIRAVVTAMAAREEEIVQESETEESKAGDDATAVNASSEAAQSTSVALPPNPDYAARLRAQLHAMHADTRYKQLFEPRRTSLAMHGVAESLVATVRAQRVTIVCGTTGCGKSTQVPQYLLDDAIERGEGDRTNILVTQPRRLSAFGIAERVAQERLSSLGEDVGYAVRLDAQPGKHITFCTTGVLLQMLVSQPNLNEASHLIIDEIHERDLNCDTLLALVKQLLVRNPTLRVVLMSATMQAEVFAGYFGNAPIINVDGAVYPVTEYFLDDIAAELTTASHTTSNNNNNNTSSSNRLRGSFYSPMFNQLAVQTAELTRSPRVGAKALLIPPKTDYRLIAHLVHHAATTHLAGRLASSSILVFLPGWREMLQAKQAIESYTLHSTTNNNRHSGTSNGPLRFYIILLHSSVESAKQRECFEPAPSGHVKVVLATNIAESGITIDDVAVVIDTGLMKQTTWTCRTQRTYAYTTNNTNTRNDSDAMQVFSTQLALGYASRANATQRRGRAGRTQGGICYRLFSRATWRRLPAYPIAEVHRTPLTQVLLKLLYLGHIAPRQTLQGFLEPPSDVHVEASMRQLQDLGAVDARERLTPLGRYLSQLPCEPRVGKMILLGAVLHCLDSVLTLAACEEASPFVGSREDAASVRQRRYLFARHSESDHVSALNAYNAFCANHESAEFARMNFLNVGNLYTIAKYKAQFRDILLSAGFCGLRDVYASSTTPINSNRDGANAVCSDDEDGVMGRYQGSLCVLDGPLSQNALNVSLVKACVCGSLFPNVAMLEPDSLTSAATNSSATRRRQPRLRPARKLALRTKAHAHIIPSKDSACRRIGGPSARATVPSREECMKALTDNNNNNSNNNTNNGDDGYDAAMMMIMRDKTVARADGGEQKRNSQGAAPAMVVKPAMFYVYEDVFVLPEARQRFLTDVSSVSLWALLLFGVSEARMTYYETVQLCMIDDWIAIRMDELTYRTVRGLRHTLELCIWQKYVSPHDVVNNAAMETLCQLSKELLSTSSDTASAMYRLSDVGVIVSPTALQGSVGGGAGGQTHMSPVSSYNNHAEDDDSGGSGSGSGEVREGDDMSDDARYGWDEVEDEDGYDDDHVYTV